MTAPPTVQHRSLSTPHGDVTGCSYRWDGGQYCSIQTPRGVVGCGIFDIAVANEFNMAFAIAKGTPAHPLREPEDLFDAKIVAVSRAAERLGVSPGMTGREAVAKMTED